VRFRMYQQFPFWAVLMERFGIYVSDQIPTACVTDDASIHWNVEFWNSLTVAQRTFVMAHEIGHKAFEHFRRRGGREPFLWNVAGDYAVNLLVAEDMPASAMPPHILHNPEWGGLTAEDIYALLEKKTKKLRVPANAWTGDMQSGDGMEGARQVSAAREAQPRTDQEWRVAVSSAMVAARMRGKMPAGLERAVLRRLEAEVDWATRLGHLLKQSLVNAGNKDQTWLPPSRRFVHQGWYFPSVNVGRCPRVAWAIDTSGSREDKHLARAHGEIDAARKVFGGEVYVMDCDAQVYTGRWVTPIEPLPMPTGGGGTDFRPVFEHIEEKQIAPDVLVFFTDTWGDFPNEPPVYPVLWVVDVPGAKVPWGEMIQVKEQS